LQDDKLPRGPAIVKIQADPLVDETSQRLYGLNALVELIYRATPDVELQEGTL
jgi:hypothetical protein